MGLVLSPNITEGNIGGKFDIADEFRILGIRAINHSGWERDGGGGLRTVLVEEYTSFERFFCQLKGFQRRELTDDFPSINEFCRIVIYGIY